VQLIEIALEVCFVGTPRQPVHASRGILLEFVERRFEMFDAEVVEERSELLLLPFACCFPYAFQRLGHAYPALRPVRVSLVRLGSTGSAADRTALFVGFPATLSSPPSSTSLPAPRDRGRG
jgi:hypothetical protein